MGAKARGWSKPDAELFDNVNPLRGDVFENGLRGSAHIGVSLQDDVYHGQMKQGLIRLWPERGQASGQASTVHFFIFSNFRITLAWRGSDGVPQRSQQADTGAARRAQMKAGGRSRNLHHSLLGTYTAAPPAGSTFSTTKTPPQRHRPGPGNKMQL